MEPFDQIRSAAQVFVRECQPNDSSQKTQPFRAERYQRLRDAQAIMEAACEKMPAHKGESSRQAMEDIRYRVSVMRDSLIPATNDSPIYRVGKKELEAICTLSLLIRTMCDNAEYDLRRGR